MRKIGALPAAILLLTFAALPLSAKGAAETGAAAKTENVTLTWWGFPAMRDYAATPVPEWAAGNDFWTVVQKRSGIKLVPMSTTVAFLQGTSNMDQAFGLLLASGQMPDIMCHSLVNYPGGPDQAIAEKIILKLNPYMDKYAPNLKKTLEAMPSLDRAVKTDQGNYFVFPAYRAKENVAIYGPSVRKDLLDQTGLAPAETVAEWEAMLRALKNVKGVESPLTFEVRRLYREYGGILCSPYGIRSELFVENNAVKFGEYDPRFKDYLAMMNRWYKDGLIDKDFPSIDKKTIVAKFTTGQAAVLMETWSWYPSMLKANAGVKGFDLIPLKTPVMNKGETPKFSQWVNRYDTYWSAMISAKCKYPEAAIKLMDYFYSDEGYTLCRYGTEGVSYKMVDGKPQYTELVTKNPGGLTMMDAAGVFGIAGEFPYIQKEFPIVEYDSQRKAIATWAATDAEKYSLPVLWLSPQESGEAARLMTDIVTYYKENVVRFMLGTRPLSEFDQYLADLRKMGIERVIELNQKAYERYLKR